MAPIRKALEPGLEAPANSEGKDSPQFLIAAVQRDVRALATPRVMDAIRAWQARAAHDAGPTGDEARRHLEALGRALLPSRVRKGPANPEEGRRLDAEVANGLLAPRGGPRAERHDGGAGPYGRASAFSAPIWVSRTGASAPPESLFAEEQNPTTAMSLPIPSEHQRIDSPPTAERDHSGIDDSRHPTTNPGRAARVEQGPDVQSLEPYRNDGLLRVEGNEGRPRGAASDGQGTLPEEHSKAAPSRTGAVVDLHRMVLHEQLEAALAELDGGDDPAASTPEMTAIASSVAMLALAPAKATPAKTASVPRPAPRRQSTRRPRASAGQVRALLPLIRPFSEEVLRVPAERRSQRFWGRWREAVGDLGVRREVVEALLIRACSTRELACGLIAEVAQVEIESVKALVRNLDEKEPSRRG